MLNLISTDKAHTSPRVYIYNVRGIMNILYQDVNYIALLLTFNPNNLYQIHLVNIQT